MANPTTNYSFAMPTNTDLVKDLPADFEIFGQAVDTQMKTNADAAIAKTIVDAKGDLIVGTAADTIARLASSANNGDLLTVDTSTASGLKWATPAGGGKVLQVVQGTTSTNATISSSAFTDSNLTATITPSSATSKVLIIIAQVFRMNSTANNVKAGMRLLRGATSIYNPGGDDTRFSQSTGSSASIHQDIFSACYLDSPATTSAITYKTQLNSGDTVVAQNSTLSTITLLEIGA
jgi:hypothetical protein